MQIGLLSMRDDRQDDEDSLEKAIEEFEHKSVILSQEIGKNCVELSKIKSKVVEMEKISKVREEEIRNFIVHAEILKSVIKRKDQCLKEIGCTINEMLGEILKLENEIKEKDMECKTVKQELRHCEIKLGLKEKEIVTKNEELLEALRLKNMTLEEFIRKQISQISQDKKEHALTNASVKPLNLLKNNDLKNVWEEFYEFISSIVSIENKDNLRQWDVNLPVKYISFLAEIVHNRYTGWIERLLKTGFPVNQVIDDCDTTLLLLSSKYNSIEIIHLLLSHKVDINFQDSSGNSALHYAAIEGHYDAVELLLYRGASVDVKNFDKNTPLHISAMQGSGKIVTLLLGHGADINATNRRKHTALTLACIYKQTSVVRQLLANPLCDVNNNPSRRYYALHLARGFKPILHLLRNCKNKSVN